MEMPVREVVELGEETRHLTPYAMIFNLSSIIKQNPSCLRVVPRDAQEEELQNSEGEETFASTGLTQKVGSN